MPPPLTTRKGPRHHCRPDLQPDPEDQSVIVIGMVAQPLGPAARRIGDEWVAGACSVVLALPSAIIPGEFNFLLNPAHPDFARIRRKKPEAFVFDARLLT